MSCEQFAPLIGELVDGTLDGAPRHRLEAHLSACRDCATLAEELLTVRRAARALAPVDLPPAARARVAAAVEAGRGPVRRASWHRHLLPLAAAAVLVAAIAAAVVWRRDQATAPPAQAPAAVADSAGATPAELMGSVDAELEQTAVHLERAVAGLELLARDRQALDPQLATELQRNLQVIDQAIGESRAALRTNPLSADAQDSLFEAFRAKIVLLQDTISLINEVRKGNQAEAARIADGMNKS